MDCFAAKDSFAYYKTKLGFIKISFRDEMLTHLEFVDKAEKNSYPTRFSDKVYKQIEEYLDGQRKVFDLPIHIEGTDFQKKVLQALCGIEYGKCASYKDIAQRIGKEHAYRAIGNACRKNPILIIIPCHRIVGTNGKLTGYVGGTEIKKKLLELESENL